MRQAKLHQSTTARRTLTAPSKWANKGASSSLGGITPASCILMLLALSLHPACLQANTGGLNSRCSRADRCGLRNAFSPSTRAATAARAAAASRAGPSVLDSSSASDSPSCTTRQMSMVFNAQLLHRTACKPKCAVSYMFCTWRKFLQYVCSVKTAHCWQWCTAWHCTQLTRSRG